MPWFSIQNGLCLQRGIWMKSLKIRMDKKNVNNFGWATGSETTQHCISIVNNIVSL